MSEKTVTINRAATTLFGTVFATLLYWHILGLMDLGPRISDIGTFVSSFVNSLTALSFAYFACMSIDRVLKRPYRGAKVLVASLALGLVFTAILSLFFTRLRPDLVSFAIFVAPLMILPILCYATLLANREWKFIFSPSPPPSRELRPIDALGRNELMEVLELDSTVATEVLELHRRANSLMNRANWVLLLIVIVLVFTAFFIIYANRIAESGIVQIDPFADLIEEQRVVGEEIEKTRNNIIENSRRLAAAKTWTDLSSILIELNEGDVDKEILQEIRRMVEFAGLLNSRKIHSCFVIKRNY